MAITNTNSCEAAMVQCDIMTDRDRACVPERGGQDEGESGDGGLCMYPQCHLYRASTVRRRVSLSDTSD